MWRRLILCFCMAIALLGLYVKGSIYLNTLRLGSWTTVPALIELAYLLTIVALALIIGRKRLSGAPNRGRRNGEEESGSAEETTGS